MLGGSQLLSALLRKHRGDKYISDYAMDRSLFPVHPSANLQGCSGSGWLSGVLEFSTCKQL